MQLHELRRAGRHEKNYYGGHLQAFYAIRDAIASVFATSALEAQLWYNDRLRDDPKAIADVLRQYENWREEA